MVTVAPTDQEFSSYDSQTITIKMIATQISDTSKTNSLVSFDLIFGSFVDMTCATSVLQDPNPVLETIIIELMASSSSTDYTLPLLPDSGTQSLAATSSHANDNCGT